MKNILLINFGGLGDEILFLPVIKALKQEFKYAKITLCTEPRSQAIIHLTNLIDEIITLDIKKKGISKYLDILGFLFKARFGNFDMVISSGSSEKVATLLSLTGIKKRFGYKSKNAKKLTSAIEINKNQYAAKMYYDLLKPISGIPFENPTIDIKNENSVNYLLSEKFKNEGYIALHPGVSKMSVKKGILKCPAPSFWVDLIKKIIEKGKNVVLLGGDEDREIIDKIASEIGKNENFINLHGKIEKIIDVVKIIKKSNTFICVDSAPMHMAVGANARVLAIFTSTDENKLLPNGDNFIAITSDVKCRPCLWDKREKCCDNPVCLEIDVNKILEKI